MHARVSAYWWRGTYLRVNRTSAVEYLSFINMSSLHALPTMTWDYLHAHSKVVYIGDISSQSTECCERIVRTTQAFDR